MGVVRNQRYIRIILCGHHKHVWLNIKVNVEIATCYQEATITSHLKTLIAKKCNKPRTHILNHKIVLSRPN